MNNFETYSFQFQVYEPAAEDFITEIFGLIQNLTDDRFDATKMAQVDQNSLGCKVS